ncbi:unnamed protein product, partial [Cuscuta epithymum]
MVFISDSKASIPKAVLKVFPCADHEFCVQHLIGNLRTKFKHPAILDLFNKCARVYKLSHFEQSMHNLEQLAADIRAYLLQIGYEKWAHCYYKRHRYGNDITNISESMNNALEEGRDLPIVPLIQKIQEKLQTWFVDRRVDASSIHTRLTPSAGQLLADQVIHGRHMEVRPNDINEYTVLQAGRSYVVYLQTRQCICRRWDHGEISCAHTCAVINKCNLSVHSFVSAYYYNESYASTFSATIHSWGNPHEWVVPNIETPTIVFPPHIKCGAGRPRKQRIPSVGEFKKSKKCKRCG